MTGAGGNSVRAQRRVVGTFAAWWAPWTWCWRRGDRPIIVGRRVKVRPRCQLRRRHLNRHAHFDGFDVRYFDTIKDGTP